MKQITILSILCILMMTSVFAQNPFEKFNYEPKIGTLSKGKYIEHFDNDSIVRIGNVMFNTYTKQINGFVVTDTVYSEATLDPTVMSRWMNPDPMSDEFPDKSPYNFVNNNPIRYVDPLGLAPEDIILSGDLTEEQRTEILTNLQKLTDDQLVYNHDNGRVEIASQNDNGSKKNGTGLLRTLINHDKDVTISVNQAGFMAGEEGTIEADIPDGVNTTNGVGTNAEVTFGTFERKFLTEDSETGEISLVTQPSFIALGHELIHANAIMDGNSSNKDAVRYYNDGNGTVFERFGVEEYRATGFSGWQRLKGNYTTENALRQENNLGRRISYGNKRFKKKN